jgi:hypothetical protein
MTLRLENDAPRPAELELHGREITVDATIVDASGRQIWHSLHEQVIPGALQLVTLAPGEAIERAFAWDLRDGSGALCPPGNYSVSATLLSGGAPLPLAHHELTVLP